MVAIPRIDRIENPTQMSDAQATKFGLKTYFHGTSYNSGNAPTVTGMTVNRAAFIPYQMQDGSWRLKGNMVGSGSSAGLTISVNGMLTKNISNYDQAISYRQPGGTTVTDGYAPFNSNTFFLNMEATETIFSISFDIELESKPTWAY